jgi:hypothetical protein
MYEDCLSCRLDEFLFPPKQAAIKESMSTYVEDATMGGIIGITAEELLATIKDNGLWEIPGKDGKHQVRLYTNPSNSREKFARIPVGRVGNMGEVFALGLPSGTGDFYAIQRKLNPSNRLIDHDDTEFWTNMSTLHQATIEIYQEWTRDMRRGPLRLVARYEHGGPAETCVPYGSERPGNPVVIRTKEDGPQQYQYRDEQNVIRIFGRPGHYNALVPTSHTERILKIFREQDVESGRGQTPSF